MQRMASFEKVTFEQFEKDMDGYGYDHETIRSIYDGLTMPKRATAHSAGYDFKCPFDVVLPPKANIKIPTGFKVHMEPGWFLAIFPRSGLGFKYRLQLDNTVGIIDKDYDESDNEGHMFIKITNDSNSNQTITINKGDGFAQGIFIPFGITMDDMVSTTRNGGFGSTDRKEGNA